MKTSSEANARLDFVDGQHRIRSVTLLFCGAMSGLCGFAFAGFLGIYRYFTEPQTNYLGNPYSSGHNYYPQTVSEMVSDPSSPSGKCFFAFCMIGALCILMSWYPWMLRNVYVGDDATMCGFRLLNLRQFCPPIGMMIVACLPVVPRPQATFRDVVTIQIHSFGAMIMIGGYSVFEMHALLSSKVHMAKKERRIRWTCVVLSVIAAIGFQFCGLLTANARNLGICCADDWRQISAKDITSAYASMHPGTAVRDMEAYEDGVPMLFNTAYGHALGIKQAEYWLEVLAGIFMIASHLTIWWFCPERHLSLKDTLPDPGTYLKGAESRPDYAGTA